MANDLLKYGLIGIGAWVLYEYFSTPATAANRTPATTATGTTATGTTAANAPTPGTTTAPASNTTPVNSFSSRPISAALLVSEAGSTTPGNLDYWAYYVNMTGATISSDLMDAIIAAAGGDRSIIVTADQFINFYTQATGNAPGTRQASSGSLKGIGPAAYDHQWRFEDGRTWWGMGLG